MKKAMMAAVIGLLFLFVPALVLGQSMSGNHHGMMAEPTLGKMGGSAGKQGALSPPYSGMMGDCAMGGPMMGYGMMHGAGMGYMNHPMMGGYGMGMSGMHGAHDWSSEEMRSFLDKTRDLRKQIHDLRFDYGEKMRNPETTIGDLQEMQKKLRGLQEQLWEEYRK